MIGVYRERLDKLIPIARNLGFRLASNEAYMAVFLRGDYWRIILEGDPREYPASTLAIELLSSPETRSYAVWLLMNVFADRIPYSRTGQIYGDQLWFLSNFGNEILSNEEAYRETYEELDRRLTGMDDD